MKRLVLAALLLAAAQPALVLPATAQTPEQNEIARKAAAERVVAGAQCKGCDLFQVDLSYKDLQGRDLSETRLRQSDLSLATLDKARFVNANLSIVEAYGARFENADFTGADMTRGSFVGAYMGGAQLKNAKLDSANLSGAYLASARGLTQVQLDRACGDATTELPAGLSIKACG